MYQAVSPWVAAQQWYGHTADRVRAAGAVERAQRRRGRLLSRGFRADRKSWAALRRKVFHDPPTERNRVWQTDFSEFETLACLDAAVDEAERVLGLDDLRDGRGEPELVDENTGEVIDVVPRSDRRRLRQRLVLSR